MDRKHIKVHFTNLQTSSSYGSLHLQIAMCSYHANVTICSSFVMFYFRCLQKAAIKKMDMQASHEFLAELKVLTHVHHLNLVSEFLVVTITITIAIAVAVAEVAYYILDFFSVRFIYL